MKTSRKILIVAGVVVGLFVLFVLALPLFIDVNAYHDIIEGRAEDTLGRDVSLGKMKLSLLPFGVRVNDIAVAALPEEGGGQLLEAESVRVGARLMPLLDKRLEITGVVIERPSIVLIVRRTGVTARAGRLVRDDQTGGDGGVAVLHDLHRFVVTARTVARLALHAGHVGGTARRVALEALGVALVVALEPIEGRGVGQTRPAFELDLVTHLALRGADVVGRTDHRRRQD